MHFSPSVVKEFLTLDEIRKNTVGLPQDEKDAAVEIQDLTCYWDKVGYMSFTALTNQNTSV